MVAPAMLLFATLYVESFAPLCALLLILAWRFGGRIELIVACLFMIATDLQRAFVALNSQSYSRFEPALAAIDWALCVSLFLLCLRRPKPWLLATAALQFLSSFGHLAKLIDVGLSPLAYAILMGSGGYPTLILLGAGIISHARNTRKTAVYDVRD